MNNAFSLAYPPERGLFGKVFLPAIDPNTYLRAGHLLLMFPLGIGYFVFLVTTFAVGGSLIWTLPGLIILPAAIFVSRFFGDTEAYLVSRVTGVEIRRPPWRTEGVTSIREKVRVRLIDPTTWTGLIYLLVQFPIGIGTFVVIVVIGAVSGSFVGAPVIVAVTDTELDFFRTDSFSLVIDNPTEALWLVPVGLLAWLAGVHIVTTVSALHGMWAKLLLGSKGRARASLPAPAPATDPDSGLGDQPGPLSPAAGAHSPTDAAAPPGPAQRTEKTPDLPAPAFAVVTDSDAWEQPLLSDLTQREREVFLLLARGLTNADIAETLFVSVGTAKTHVKRILSKLDLRDRTRVVIFAYESGLVAPSVEAELANIALEFRSLTR